MGNLFSTPTTAAKQAKRAMGIQMQGSQYGPAVPVLYGRNKVAGNCVWYGDFQAVKHQQNVGGKGGGATSTSYTYSASFQLGLCEGPIADVRTIYSGTSTISASQIGAVFATGAIGQAPWSHLSSPFDLGYSRTALFSVQNLNLGSSATLPNYNFEVDGLKQFSSSVADSNPADILTDICTDTDHGIGFNLLGDLTQYSDYCVATGLFLSPVYSQQQSANQSLSDLFKWTNSYAYFSENQLKVVPLGDQAVTGNGVTYTPNVTPVVDLGPDDLLVQSPTDPPVQIDRSAPQDAMNLVRVEFQDRSQSYHTSGVVASIDEDVIANGMRADSSVQIDACTQGSVARFIAQNMVQRAFFVRNTYTFRLGWRYCYLEPTDLVTLTDATTGLDKYPVRITQIEEDDHGTLTVTAEEFPEGIGHSASYAYETPNGTIIDTNVDPGAVNSPFLFRGPGFLINGSQPEIWCAVNGSQEYWSACEVYLSYDGSSYQWLGTYTGGARYGYIASGSSLPSGTDPDTTNTPIVQLNAPGTLAGGSQADADNFNTLAIVDSEVISYETATLQSANAYKLGYLRRGGYGSAIASHAADAPFARLDDGIIRIPVDPSLIGTTVYLKFLSINCFGRTPRTLADETAYSYVVGTNEELPDVPLTPANFATQGVADGVSITWTNTNPAAVGCTSIERSTASTGPWTVIAQLGPTTTGYTDHFTNGATFYYRARARGPLVSSGWSAYTDVFNSTGTDVSKAISDAVAPVQTQVNQLQIINLSFAQGMLGWTPTADAGNWYAESLGNGPGGAATYVVHRNSGTLTQLGNANAVPVYPGMVIKATGQIKGVSGSNGGASLYITFYDSSKATLSVLNSNIASGDGFHQLELTAVAPANAAFALVGPSVSSSATTGYYTFANFWWNYQPSTLDEVPDSSTYLKSLARAQGLVENGDFETGDASLMPPPGWVPNGGYVSSAGYETASPYSGSRSFVFVGNQYAGYTSARTYQVTPGDYYAVGGACSGYGGAAAFGLYFFNAAGAQLDQVAITSPTTGYGYSTATGKVPAGAVYGKLVISNIAAGATSTGFDALFCARCPGYDNTLAIAGSGQRIGDQRNLPAVTFSNFGSGWNGLNLSYSSTTTSATISASAATLQAGSVAINYNASSVTVSGSAGSTVKYYLYYQDPTHSGGAQTLQASTSVINALNNDGNVYLAAFSVTFPTSGTSTGTGVGLCPLRSAWVIKRGRNGKRIYVRAGKIREGDEILLINGAWGRVMASRAAESECVRLVIHGAGTLGCSVTAPIKGKHGDILAADALDEKVLIWRIDQRYCRVSAVHPLGMQAVQHISVEGPEHHFWTGDAKECLFAHHNAKSPYS